MKNQLISIFKKESFTFFEGLQAWIILGVYILLSMFITFFVGGFFSINNMGLFSFFYFQPYIMAFLIPAITMRLWAEERKTGTLEFLLTQPVSVTSVVVGKFMSAWFMCLCMLLLSTPLWIYLNVCFEADNLNILCGYIACILLSGSFCALRCLISSFCSAPAISYLWSLIVLFFICADDFSNIIKLFHFPLNIEIKLSNSLNLSSQYNDLISGQVSFDNFLYFIFLMIICLVLNNISVEYKKN